MLDYSKVRETGCHHCKVLFNNCDDVVEVRAAQARSVKVKWDAIPGEVYFTEKVLEPQNQIRAIRYHQHCWIHIAGLELVP